MVVRVSGDDQRTGNESDCVLFAYIYKPLKKSVHTHAHVLQDILEHTRKLIY